MPKIRGGRIEERGGLELVASLMGVDIACKTPEKIRWDCESLEGEK